MRRPGLTLLGTMRSVCCAVLLASCATPLPPSGGPPDDTPPSILTSDPAAGDVNVGRGTVSITFSEYVDESSLSRALSISPAPDVAPEIAWDGHRVEIRFRDDLRENTTYVIALDTELRDIHSVPLTSPITFAFSTGASINAGKLSGRVVDAAAGAPVTGIDVFAYALPDSSAPDSLPPRPAYRTQTDGSGVFQFDYLTEQHYFVAAVQDENRNLAPDPQESFAAPPTPALHADTVGAAFDVPWLLSRLDTTRPAPLRVQSLAASRHALRLSEPVRFTDRDASAWELEDTTSGVRSEIRELYMLEEDPRQVYFSTDELDAVPFVLRPAALVDTSGNPVEQPALEFTPSSAADTLELRFLGFLPDPAQRPDSMLPRGVEPGLRFNAPVPDEWFERYVRILDSSGTALAFSAVTKDGTSYALSPDPALQVLQRIEVRVDGSGLPSADTVFAAAFRRLPVSETGEIRGVARSDVHPVVVAAYPVEVEGEVPVYESRADSTGVFLFSGLPAGTYGLRAFGDLDEDGAWSGGTLIPYRGPEPIVWLAEPTRVRARWETSLPDTLRITPPR